MAATDAGGTLSPLEQQGELSSAKLFYYDTAFMLEDGGCVRTVSDFFLVEAEAAALARGEGLGMNNESRPVYVDWSESDDEGTNNLAEMCLLRLINFCHNVRQICSAGTILWANNSPL